MTRPQKYKAISARVAKAVAEERMRRGISMNQLAETAGLSLTMVSYVERGLRNPTLDTLLRITDALEIDLGVLITAARQSARRS